MTIEQFEKEFPSLPKVEFRNRHGERFVVWLTENPLAELQSCVFGGDETRQEVISLFNRRFAIWSREELRQLGDALLRLTEGAAPVTTDAKEAKR